MKSNQLQIWIPLVIIFFVAACGGSAPADETETVAQNEGPVQWITYTPENAVDPPKRVVLVSGDEEYRSEEALPQLAKILSQQHGFNCTVLFAQNPSEPGIIDPNYTGNIPGLEALDNADLLILFTRFRNLPAEQMMHFEQFLKAGKPVIGIRTSTHAFNYKDTTHQYYKWGNYYKEAGSPWEGGFGRLVLGERWHTHHGHHKHQSTRGILAEGAGEHPITNGIESGDIWGPTDVYGVRLPLPGDSQPIILGQSIDREGEFDDQDAFYGLRATDQKIANNNPAAKKPYNPNDPMMPIAWTKSYQLPGGQTGKAFTSTIGSSTDMMNEGVRRLLVNASYFLLGLEVPASAKVDLVGNYQPSAYNFQKDEYWDAKKMKIEDLVE